MNRSEIIKAIQGTRWELLDEPHCARENGLHAELVRSSDFANRLQELDPGNSFVQDALDRVNERMEKLDKHREACQVCQDFYNTAERAK